MGADAGRAVARMDTQAIESSLTAARPGAPETGLGHFGARRERLPAAATLFNAKRYAPATARHRAGPVLINADSNSQNPSVAVVFGPEEARALSYVWDLMATPEMQLRYGKLAWDDQAISKLVLFLFDVALMGTKGRNWQSDWLKEAFCRSEQDFEDLRKEVLDKVETKLDALREP